MLAVAPLELQGGVSIECRLAEWVSSESHTPESLWPLALVVKILSWSVTLIAISLLARGRDRHRPSSEA